VLLAFLYLSIRRYVFHDADNLNTTFDAGGRVSTSLTAVTVASQLLWPGDLLQSATVTIKVNFHGSILSSSHKRSGWVRGGGGVQDKKVEFKFKPKGMVD
jgi:hypothetical protein